MNALLLTELLFVPLYVAHSLIHSNVGHGDIAVVCACITAVIFTLTHKIGDLVIIPLITGFNIATVMVLHIDPSEQAHRNILMILVIIEGVLGITNLIPC
jgi:uncharacterized protein YsxB (DUF464 family)